MLIIRGSAAGSRSEQRSDTFTGTVWADPVLPQVDGVAVNHVIFSPGARSYWHSHERGQLLHVTGGQGWVCRREGQAEPVRAGDLVWAPPGERHWHGAGDRHVLVHLAVSLGATAWQDEVDEEEYRSAAGGA